MGKDNKKKNNQSNKDTTSKRPASSSPTGNVSGQGSSMSGPSNTPPSTTSTNKRTRVSTDDSVMDVDKPLTPPGPVETTSAEIPSQPDTSSLDASQHSLSLNVLPLRTRPKLQYNLNLHFSTPRPLLMTRATCSGSNDLKRIIVHFRKKEDLDNATAFPMDSLRAYVALLAGLPRGTIAVDLAEIADEISAKSINVPFSMNSYNPKPYAYCHFASETAMENAKSISCALKKVGLTWHSPDEVTSLCHRCGRPNCNPDRCGSSSRPNRPSRPWQSNDKLRALYNKHLPPSHPAKRHNRFARPDNNNDGQSRTNASRHRSKSRPNNRQQSRSRSQHRPWNRDNLNNNNINQRRRIPDANELDHYADGMDVTYPAPPTVLTDWKSIGAALEKVVEELALLTTQFATMNSRITNLESAMAARAPIPGPFVTKPPSYIPSSMQGWDDTVNQTDNNILVDVNSPPLQSTSGFSPIPHFAPIPPSNVAPSSPIDMEQRLSSLSDTVASLAGSIKEGIQQNNLILARQQGQANQ
ncbi:hypothetical protein GLOIN_2v1785090 [Rhizophagus irregularis DAOM 181602=DAOM 197198]|nr:hypothetical protein GLOIN_2v1785090 [Rhizophagus irregularis DAOM 181602=DAOM 197198]